MTTLDTDVLILGAGPVGLTLANLLGVRGNSAIVLEQRSQLIDYPRGVGLDDESIRTLVTTGLWPEIQQYTVPNHVARFVNGKGQILATNAPKGDDFGFARKHGFIQPLVDKELATGLDRFAGTELRFNHRGAGITHHDDHVEVSVERLAGEDVVETLTLRAKYLVGAEGGSSFTRKWMGAEFVGKSPSTRWVVVDVADDPIGTPSVYLGADPRRPYVSIGLPHGIRRWEFMLFDHERTEVVDDPTWMNELIGRFLPDPEAVTVINKRVFTHHGRIATTFRKGRVFVAGDAAHLMPVWLGQGWNSGIRDATNLSWKLSSVLDGLNDDALLDTYTQERHKHASDMIDINMYVGALMKCGPVVGKLRDVALGALNVVPTIKSYFTDLRFKPMPRYATGVVVDQLTLTPGHAEPTFARGRLLPFVDSAGEVSPVGLQFIQPRVTVTTAAGTTRSNVLLDEVTGDWWAIAAWGNNPARFLSPDDLVVVQRLGIKLIAVMPDTQRPWAEKQFADSPVPVTVVGDPTGRLKDWFDTRACGVVVLRPDHFVAAACLAQQTSQAFAAVLTASSYRPAAEGARR